MSPKMDRNDTVLAFIRLGKAVGDIAIANRGVCRGVYGVWGCVFGPAFKARTRINFLHSK